MRCPACGTKFKSLSSWPLAAGRPVVCGNCGTAVALLFAFHQMIGMFALTLSGTVLLLVGLILLSMTVDEATIQLVPIDGPAPDPEDAPKA